MWRVGHLFCKSCIYCPYWTKSLSLSTYLWSTYQKEQMPPRRLSILTQEFEFRGQPKKIIFFLKLFFQFFFSFYMYIQIFSADATIALKKIKIIFLDSSQLIFSPSLSETTLIWLRLKNAINKKLSSQIPIQNRFSWFLWLSTINKCKNKNFKVKLSLLKKVLKQFEQSTLIEFVNNW